MHTRVLFLFLTLSIGGIRTGGCYPSDAYCNCPFHIGRDDPNNPYTPPSNDHVDVCTGTYAVALFKPCICKFVLTPEAVKRNEKERQECLERDPNSNCFFIAHSPSHASADDLMLNPEY